MAGEDDVERFFRPRPESAPGAEVPVDERPEGVSVDGVPAPRVAVDARSARRRPGTRSSVAGARRQRRFLMVTGAMSAFVLLTSGGAWAFQGYVLGSLDKINPFAGLGDDRPDGGPKGTMNILVAGVDRRAGLSQSQIRRLKLGRFEGERSDTLMLVHVSRDRDKVSVVSFPRDSLVTIPSHRSNGTEGAKGTRVGARQGKLNWAYTYGGPQLAIETVERSTGIRIDHYVEVNFLGFLKMVDTLGGVDVCTEQPVNDPKSGLVLNAGTTHVNGEQALAYARARYTLPGGSDLGRVERQQRFLASMMKQALSTSTLSDPVKATRFLNATLGAIRIDEKLADELPDLAKQMKNLSTDNVTFTTVPLSDENHMTSIAGSAPQSTVLWDQTRAYDLFRKINRDEPLVERAATPTPTPTRDPNTPTVPPARIPVVVRNAHGTVGLAARAGGDLREVGFPVTVAPGVARRGLTTTTIQYGPGRADSARTLAAAIPGARLKQLPALGDRIQVLVGSDWKGARKVTVAGATPTPSASPRSEPRTATQNVCK
ncbi:LytR family transcriptional regulator [Actinomadura craniellae]|uniref:LytR family transcriptional regulator n=1 Tax=Actinomadura craniellae TaxID=2231787 RepID=A0A365GZ96_9ACTN|nr:LCP family protein [Actinomadura craniellae]RAY12142.1 LytR family transcriptional regulator [Actinomadura craniellae]